MQNKEKERNSIRSIEFKPSPDNRSETNLPKNPNWIHQQLQLNTTIIEIKILGKDGIRGYLHMFDACINSPRVSN